MEYHQDRFDDYSLLIIKDSILVAVLPANKIDQTLYSHQGLTYGGLVIGDTTKFKEIFCCFEAILKFLNNEGLDCLELKLIPSIYHHLPSDELKYMLFKTNAVLKRTDVLSVVDASNKLEIVSSNRKRGLKRALKNGLIVKEEDSFNLFWTEILIPNLAINHGVKPVHSLQEITQLKKDFPQNIRQFNVYHNDKIVAGTTIFESTIVAHVQYISANENKQQLGSLDLLFNELINNTFQLKPFFDFGISNENQGQQINSGLLEWKESFGARSVVQEFYTIQTKNYVKLKDVML